MVTVYLRKKQKMEFVGYMLWNYYLLYLKSELVTKDCLCSL